MKAGLLLLTSLCLLVLGRAAPPAFGQDDSLSPAGKSFIKEVASVNLMEVQLGQTARDKGSAREVRDYGDLMVREHTRANEELKTIAARSNLKLPLQVERKHTLMIARLSKLSGGEFDREYLQTMVKNHLNSTARFKKATKGVKDRDLNVWAATTLPMLQHHLQLAKDVALKLGRR
jgi:putative membrane protein